MATTTITVPLPDDHAEPAWEVALLFPAQGEWSEDDYLWLTDRIRRLVEFTDGRVEVLPMPAAAIGTGLVQTSCWRWSVLTTRNVIWCGNAGSMPGQGFPNIGLSTR